MGAKKRVAPPPTDARRTRARTNAPPILDIANHLECSICMSLFHDPVTISSGQTFDLDCLKMHLEQGSTTCPMSRTDLKDNSYAFPNVTIRSMVADYIEKHPGAGELTPRQSFEPILLLDPKIRKEAKLKALIKQLHEAVEVGVQVAVMNKLNIEIDGDQEAAQMLAAIPEALLLIVRCLSSESEDCRRDAAYAIADIALVNECRPLIAHTPDALIKLEGLLAPNEPDRVRASAARAIGNVADIEEARRLVLDVPGVIGSIASCLSSENDDTLSFSMFAVESLSFDEQAAFAILRMKGVLPNLVRGMRHDNVGVRQNSNCALYNLSKGARNREMIANHPEVLTLLVQCLRDDSDIVRWNAVAALANLAADHDSIRTKIATIPDVLMLLIQLERNDPVEGLHKDAKLALDYLSKNPEINTTIERLKRQRQ